MDPYSKKEEKEINEALAVTNIEVEYDETELELEEDPYATLNQIYENQEKQTRKGVNDNKKMAKQIDYDSYDVPEGEGGQYFKPQEGKNRIRLVTKPFELKYWEEGADKSYETHILAEGEDAPEGKDVKTKYSYLILNRDDENKVQIYEAPITVFRQIMDYATDKEYGDPQMYDLTISKSGSGLQTKYSVIASPKKEDLTDDEVKAIAEVKQLEDVYAPKEEDEDSK